MYKRDEHKIQSRLKSDYEYLTSLGYEVMAVVLQGSQNYDLDYEGSDIDTKAMVLPNFKNFILSKKPVSTTLVLDSNEHIDVKDIRPLFDSFLKQNINFLEFLFSKYSYVNPLYADAMQKLVDNREMIAHYDNYKAVNCMLGMMHQKHKALEHPYPATKDKIEKFGYDGKQLHHIMRCYNFLDRYTSGVSFEDCLVSGDREKLVRIKRNQEYTLEEARAAAKFYVQKGQELKSRYAATHKNVINKEVEQLFEDVMVSTLTDYCKRLFVKEGL